MSLNSKIKEYSFVVDGDTDYPITAVSVAVLDNLLLDSSRTTSTRLKEFSIGVIDKHYVDISDIPSLYVEMLDIVKDEFLLNLKEIMNDKD